MCIRDRDPTVLNMTDYAEGSFLQSGGNTFFFPILVNYTTGTLSGLMCGLLGDVPGVSGNGTLAKLTFRALAVGTSPINVSKEDRHWTGLLNSVGFIPYNDQDGKVTVLSEKAKRLAIKVSGELDYKALEEINVKIVALVSDAETMERVSDANVTIKIYDPDDNLWISDQMIERPEGTGIYQWESDRTVAEIPKKGIYVAHVQASFKGGPIVSDIVEFHIDPPYSEKELEPKIVMVGILLGLIATGITAVVLIVKKEKF